MNYPETALFEESTAGHKSRNDCRIPMSHFSFSPRGFSSARPKIVVRLFGFLVNKRSRISDSNSEAEEICRTYPRILLKRSQKRIFSQLALATVLRRSLFRCPSSVLAADAVRPMTPCAGQTLAVRRCRRTMDKKQSQLSYFAYFPSSVQQFHLTS